jgi:hypothetical protein
MTQELRNTSPQTTLAFTDSGRGIVRLAPGVRCPCGWELRAADVDIDAGHDFQVHLVCAACHQDVLLIESTEV